MYNYHNLNDVEFESLCLDIMQQKLDMPLRIYAKGRDKGIDLSDLSLPHKVLIQVKHYINSSFANIRTAMEKEIAKVNKLQPQKYYICIGKQLTDANIVELYAMFEPFMDSTGNVITLNEIDSLLQEKDYNWIVRKHYKLWLHASNILSEIYNQDIFVDCEVLMSDINSESNYFVATSAYEECLIKLRKERALVLLGDPGVGKTITSKMLVLFWASKGYRVRYTTNGDISNIKKAISSERQAKEIILLDDCLGQHYFAIKETQESELVSLLKFVMLYPNKMILLNSRIAIFNQAKNRSSELADYISNGNIKISVINMDCISRVEKAKIFYNHLKYKCVPKEFYDELITDKQYKIIVQHPNYTPRIIEYVTSSAYYKDMAPNVYINFVLQSLTFPNNIWKNEFEQRLQSIDRILMNTLYSLTDTSVATKVLEECFNYRLLREDNIDTSLNQFEATVSRLNGALIHIIDREGTHSIGAINPSINDYLKQYLSRNTLEMRKIRESILYYKQVLRSYDSDEIETVIKEYLADGRIMALHFDSIESKNHFIASQVCIHQTLNIVYRPVLLDYLLAGTSSIEVRVLQQPHSKGTPKEDFLAKDSIFTKLLEEPLFSYYCIEQFVMESDNINEIIQWFDWDDLDSIAISLYDVIINSRVGDVPVQACMDKLTCAIEATLKDFAENVDVAYYCERYDIQQLIEDNSYYTECGREIEENVIKSTVNTYVKDDFREEVDSILDNLPIELKGNIIFKSDYICIADSDIDSIIESYCEPDYDYDYDEDRYHSDADYDTSDSLMIEAIFERE